MIQRPTVYFALILGSLGFSQLNAQDSPNQDIKQGQNLAQAIHASEELLSKFPKNDFTPNVMFQLVELYAKRSVLNFERDMLIFEVAEENHDKGLTATEPVFPKIDYSDAISLATTLLEKFPNAGFSDKVIYRIAYCYLEQGDDAFAMEYFERLAQETDDKQLLEEAYFRLGEYNFEQKHYRTAIDYYDRPLTSWDSPYFDMALYKLGWSQYNIDNYSEAIGYFLYLIDDIKLLERLETELAGKTKTDLHAEAIEYAAICFAEFGGAEKAREFLSEHKDKPYTKTILLHLVDILQKRNFYTDAIDALKVLLDFYADEPEAAQFQKRIVENYELAGENKKADAARETLISEYGPGSDWLARLGDDDIKKDVLSVAENFLYTLGTAAQERARQTQDITEYDLAIEKYQRFIEKFASSDRVA
ncbi:MAG: tol-pal system YbgF family protein, partial [bacterium]